MKTSGFLKKNSLALGFLTQLLNRSRNKNRSQSLEDLKQEITTKDYQNKVKLLINQDLQLRYTPETVKEGLENLTIKITAENPSQLEVVKEEEPVPLQEPPTPEVRINEILTEEKKQEIWKVQSRVPKWFKNPHQINSRILIAYLDLLGDDKSVSVQKLQAACRSIKTFQTNYSQMKIIAERNHAKIFEEVGNRITLWEPVSQFVIKEHQKYLRRR